MISHSYDFSKPQKRYYLRRLFLIVILLSPFVIDQFVNIDYIKPSYIYYVVGFLLAIIHNELIHYHPCRLDFDEKGKKLRIAAKTFLGKSKTYELHFSEIKLNVWSNKRKGFRKIYLLEFCKSNKVIASIFTESKGFNSNDLYFIYKTSEKCGIKNNLE
jgi:uncharacterized membrane protein YcgQ (UPF0703/DUF1980 family)